MKAFLWLVMATILVLPLSQAAGADTLDLTRGGNMILVEGGCGADYRRNDRGYCVPSWTEASPPGTCSPGWHLRPGKYQVSAELAIAFTDTTISPLARRCGHRSPSRHFPL
jgi:hypothetical protein